jgi:hypothetical protein
MKIRPVGAELFHADRRTDLRLIVAFRNLSKATKTLYFVSRPFILLHTLHIHYRKQYICAEIIIVGSGNSTVHQGCQQLQVVWLGVVFFHDFLKITHVRSYFKFMTIC